MLGKILARLAAAVTIAVAMAASSAYADTVHKLALQISDNNPQKMKRNAELRAVMSFLKKYPAIRKLLISRPAD